jgi:sensor histidine kinase YesM
MSLTPKIHPFLKRRVVLEVLIFAAIYLVNLYETTNLLARQPESYRSSLILYLSGLWSCWAYGYARFILDRFLLAQKFIHYFLLTLAGLSLTTWLELEILQGTDLGDKNTFSPIFTVLSLYTAVITVVYLAAKYLIKSREFYELEASRRGTELNQLKNQLNPHFLLNALNNIYGHNLANSGQGNDLILKLSQLMKYILDSTKKESVLLRDEAIFIENYIAFEKERVGYRCNIIFVCHLSESSNRLIPPLLLFPLVENAFKHGTNALSNSTVEITLTESVHELSMVVKNQILGTGAVSTQTGLANMRRRLQLIYPTRHRLLIQQDEKYFEAMLTIQY